MKIKSNQKYKSAGTILLIPLEEIKPNPFQPRKDFDEAGLQRLALSVRYNGIIQPLVIRKADSGYCLISGERRLRAAGIVGLKTVPCIVMSATDFESAVFSVIENIQRRELIENEKNEAVEAVCRQFFADRDKIKERLGLIGADLSGFSLEVRNKIKEKNLTDEQISELLKLKNSEKIGDVIDYISENSLTAGETVEYIKNLNSPVIRPQPKFKKLKDIRIFVNTIKHAVDTMQAVGINAVSAEHETDAYYEYVVRIPKTTTSPVSSERYAGSAV